ncbi:glycosyltransferase [Herbaspirillum sp. C7C8]|uniref:glycosyltransferase n=1 Tax=Herbaspirillum sp. C7C8 TaxID=2736665 RepID=UPI001F529D2F|nr:glycosyltransferase [Herbaspirillum sp. C7C8]MCI1004764.1 glycosyltransferase [Herbaspirillum sp. C7C8]
MRIAYLTSVYARASDTFIRNEVLELRRRGHEVQTFSIRREAGDAAVSADVKSEQASTDYILENGLPRLLGVTLLTILRSPGRVLEVLKLAHRTRAGGLRPALLHVLYLIEACYLARRLTEQKIQILHNHIAENSATVAMYASMLSGIPYSMTVHGPGIFFHPVAWALGEKVQRSAFTATITHFCKSQCMLFSDVQAWSRLNVVRCGVGPAFEDAPALPIPAVPRLVFVGRLCAEKGVPLLIEAVARHVSAGKPCELVLVGDGPLRPFIEKAMVSGPLAKVIRILGWKSSAEVRAEIECSRALVLPSFAEGLPVVVMEALALSRPVISTRIAGIAELVEHDVNGWVVSPGSVDELVAAIDQATSASVERLQEMGLHGAKAVRQKHHLGTEVSKLEQLFAAHGLRQS